MVIYNKQSSFLDFYTHRDFQVGALTGGKYVLAGYSNDDGTYGRGNKLFFVDEYGEQLQAPTILNYENADSQITKLNFDDDGNVYVAISQVWWNQGGSGEYSGYVNVYKVSPTGEILLSSTIEDNLSSPGNFEFEKADSGGFVLAISNGGGSSVPASIYELDSSLNVRNQLSTEAADHFVIRGDKVWQFENYTKRSEDKITAKVTDLTNLSTNEFEFENPFKFDSTGRYKVVGTEEGFFLATNTGKIQKFSEDFLPLSEKLDFGSDDEYLGHMGDWHFEVINVKGKKDTLGLVYHRENADGHFGAYFKQYSTDLDLLNEELVHIDTDRFHTALDVGFNIGYDGSFIALHTRNGGNEYGTVDYGDVKFTVGKIDTTKLENIPETIIAGEGDDYIIGDGDRNYISTGGGNDQVISGAGDDVVIVQGEGEVEVDTGIGDDRVVVEEGFLAHCL